MNFGLDPLTLPLARFADIAITCLIGMMVVLSLLILRQARHMVQVLPTPMSPIVRLTVVGFTFATIAALVIAIGTFFST